MKLKRLAPWLVLLALLVAPARPARAHADLLQATPEFNASLERAPAQIELFFSEPIEAGFSTIKVLDATGKQVDSDDARVDASNPARMTVSLRSIPDGIYTVSWKALSLVDSHITAGAYPFAVGDVDPDALAAASAGQSTQLSTGEILFRWITYLAGAALIGGLLFRLLVWMPVADGFSPVALTEPNWRTPAVISLALLVAANILGFLVQVGQLIEEGLAVPWNPASTQLLFSTRYGLLWILRFVVVLIATRLTLQPTDRRHLWVGLGSLTLIPLTFSLGSHAAAEPQAFFPVSADLLHILSASFWIGGLISLIQSVTVLRAHDAERATRATARLIPRFSGLAVISVGALLITGVYAAVLRVGSFEALTSTLYGRVLLVKSLLALPLLMLGALNLLVTSKSMKAAADLSETGDRALVGRFRWLVTAEAVLGAAILLVAGVLTAIPPVQATATESTLRAAVASDDLDIGITVNPGQIGPNRFEVAIEESQGPLLGAREVSIEFIPLNVDLPATTVTLDEVGSGIYAAEGAFLSLPDEWLLQVAVRRDNQFDTFANFPFSVGVSQSQNIPWNQLTGALLLAGAGIFWFALQSFDLNARTRLVAVRLPALLLVIAAGWAYVLPVSASERFVNPIPPSAESVAQGEAIYRAHCIACHGPTGGGDGPLGLALNPPPANLIFHTEPGVHPDGQLFEWISFGFPDGSVMPAFEDTLSTDDHWHVVNYIRTFGADPKNE